jgi:hypothetical protein
MRVIIIVMYCDVTSLYCMQYMCVYPLTFYSLNQYHFMQVKYNITRTACGMIWKSAIVGIEVVHAY